MLLKPLSDLQSSSKNGPAVISPNAEDWRLARLKLATMRLRDAIEETENHSDEQYERGDPCWLDKI
jgi:glycine/D-amino acid oxidase-like deaminating enzyme